MATMRRWTGREARALRAALRYSVRGFAEYLGVGVRTVATWEASGDRVVPRPVMQSTLDTTLSRADADAKARFAELLEVGFSRRDLPILLAAIGQPFRHGRDSTGSCS